MGMLIKFELRKILGNKAGMAACALTLALLCAFACLNVLTAGWRDYESGEYVRGKEAQQALRATSMRHAAALTDERVAEDMAVLDRARELWNANPDLAGKGDSEYAGDAAILHGVDFWRETGAVLTDTYYLKLDNALDVDADGVRAVSLEEGAHDLLALELQAGFVCEFPYSDSEVALWEAMASKVSWPLAYGYAGAWKNVLSCLGMSGLAVVATCIALSGAYAGEYQTRAVAVALPTKRGKRDLPVAKTLASLIFASAYWWACVLAVMATNVGLCGADGWSLPYQVIAGFGSPYALTVGEVVMLSSLLGYVITLGMSALTLALSARMGSTMPVAVITMGMTFMGLLALFVTPVMKVALLTPMSGLNYIYASMVSYTVGSVAADLPTVLAVLYAIMCVVLIPLAMRAFRRHQVA